MRQAERTRTQQDCRKNHREHSIHALKLHLGKAGRTRTKSTDPEVGGDHLDADQTQLVEELIQVEEAHRDEAEITAEALRAARAREPEEENQEGEEETKDEDLPNESLKEPPFFLVLLCFFVLLVLFAF